ncbi:hypothetical protein I6F09_28280 [Bradyrhizobium sp. IC3195]|uniref:hypothetical protein n=1 Tax=Bradyrhizobium sp. IC3195 TaxID=2793804 RepID=UPI001CD735A3|nr:hypothetical protein [Bradyrhizobium sp. IC3195]MCA1471766.1 hypothetical protein [Bradyrhizobium sp. IC3195]
MNASHMHGRITLFASALIVFTVAILLFEAHASHRAPDHCGFWTTIEAGLSCR